MRPFCATLPNHHKAVADANGGPGAARLSDQPGRNRVLDRTQTIDPALAPPGATPTTDSQKRRIADFATLGEALDYAALGKRGLNFHDARGTLRSEERRVGNESRC